MSRLSPLALPVDVLCNHLLSPRRRPFLASYKLTYRCNLRCQQCVFHGYTSPDPDFNQVCSTLAELRRRGDRVVIFEGGEPLLWRDGPRRFADVVGAARSLFGCVGVTTNGTLPLDLDTDILWGSVDGFAETHNRLRQAPIFDQVIANLRGCRHPRLYAHITANRENAAEIPALARYLAGLVRGITVQFYYPYGADDHLFLPRTERSALIDQLIRLKAEGIPLLNSNAALRALQAGRWRCQAWRIDCVNPDGSITQGCYLQNRAEIDCEKCGFSPYTEISLAFQGNPQSILAGLKIFA